jgi:predicted nucleic acid-binding Zn ribbon protein
VLLLGGRRGKHRDVDAGYQPPPPVVPSQPSSSAPKSPPAYKREPDPSLPSTQIWLKSDLDAGHQDQSSPVSELQSGSVRCPVCDTPAQPGDQFCASCGAEIPRRPAPRFCRYCGAPLRDRSRFCGKCGKAV